MSEFTHPGQASFIAEAQRLHAAVLAAPDAESREHAEHELSHFLRMNAAGRLQEYFASRQASEDR